MTTRILTPLGPMVVGATDEGICLLEFADRRMLATQFQRLGQRFGYRFVPGSNQHVAQLQRELDEYFDERRTEFSVPLVTAGPPFQERVWEALAKIPCGSTTTYSDLARSIGRPTAIRAVGTANGANRLTILIPCHRVLNKHGQLHAYGGGLWRKRWLLALERRSTT